MHSSFTIPLLSSFALGEIQKLWKGNDALRYTHALSFSLFLVYQRNVSMSSLFLLFSTMLFQFLALAVVIPEIPQYTSCYYFLTERTKIHCNGVKKYLTITNRPALVANIYVSCISCVLQSLDRLIALLMQGGIKWKQFRKRRMSTAFSLNFKRTQAICAVRRFANPCGICRASMAHFIYVFWEMDHRSRRQL